VHIALPMSSTGRIGPRRHCRCPTAGTHADRVCAHVRTARGARGHDRVPAFKKAVGPKGYDELGDQFEDIERRTFGGDGFDIAIDKIADIERRLGLADLNAFTAPALT